MTQNLTVSLHLPTKVLSLDISMYSGKETMNNQDISKFKQELE